MSAKHLSELAFAELPLPEPLHQAIRDMGFTHCTPIQAKALPLALKGRDVAGQGQTGTGKTAAFLLATFKRLLEVPRNPDQAPTDPRAIIIAPTRELAIQIDRDAEAIGQHCELKRALIYGGVDYIKQRETLQQGVDLLIGTPGRIIDYFKQRVYSLKAIEVAVLDEADRMFDLGFIKDIRFLFRRMPPAHKRLNMMFSATLSFRVLELAYEHMNDPQKVEVDAEQVTARNIKQVVYLPASDEKIRLLVGLLGRMDPKRTMVFVNTKAWVERVTDYLTANGIEAAALSGDVPQRKRQRLLKRFHDGDLPVMVATDVAARGLHVPEVSHVFNFDLPQDPEDYVHRIGRTARLGASGDAISFACETSAYTLPDIEKYIGDKLIVESVTESLLPEIKRPPRRPPRQRGGRGGGKRGSGGGGRGNGAKRNGSGGGGENQRRGRGRRGRKNPAPASD